MLLKPLFFFIALLFSIFYGYASPQSQDKCSRLFGEDESSSAQKLGVKEESESQKNPKLLTSKVQQKRGEKEVRPVRGGVDVPGSISTQTQMQIKITETQEDVKTIAKTMLRNLQEMREHREKTDQRIEENLREFREQSAKTAKESKK